MFYNYLKSECERQGLKITPIVLECGGARGSIANWKSGAAPNSDIVVKLSVRLNVSCDYLLTGKNVSTKPTLQLTENEQELLDAYRKLDKRGQYKLHTVMYEEVDRVTAAGGTVAEAAAIPPQKAKLPPNYPENYPVDEYGDPLVPWAASGWADITPENAEKLQQKLQEFERKSRAQMELEAAKNAAVLKGMPKKE